MEQIENRIIGSEFEREDSVDRSGLIFNDNVLRKTVNEIIHDYKSDGLRRNSRTNGDLTFRLDDNIITVTTSRDDSKPYRRYAVIFINRQNPLGRYGEFFFYDYNFSQ